MTATMGCDSAAFRFEVELGPPVRAWLEQRCGVVAEEVDTGESGVVDLVGACSSWAADDLAALIPVAGVHRMAVVDRCADGLTEAELRASTRMRWAHYRATYVEPLVRSGAVAFDGATYRACVEVTDPFDEVTAVELKLRNWRDAVRQARRNFRFADHSYAALPLERLTADAVDSAAEWGVGLLGVTPDAVTVVRESTGRRGSHDPYRLLAAQRLLEATRSPSERCAGASFAGQVKRPLG